MSVLYVELEWPERDSRVEGLIISDLSPQYAPCYVRNAGYTPYHRGLYIFAVADLPMTSLYYFFETGLSYFAKKEFGVDFENVSFIAHTDGSHDPTDRYSFYRHYIYNVIEMDSLSEIPVSAVWAPLIELNIQDFDLNAKNLANVSSHLEALSNAEADYFRLKAAYRK